MPPHAPSPAPRARPRRRPPRARFPLRGRGPRLPGRSRGRSLPRRARESEPRRSRLARDWRARPRERGRRPGDAADLFLQRRQTRAIRLEEPLLPPDGPPLAFLRLAAPPLRPDLEDPHLLRPELPPARVGGPLAPRPS